MLKKCLVLFLCTLPLVAGPKLVFEKTDHDFGDIDKGDKVETEFKFTNTGDEVLQIQDVKPSCGCTSAKPEKASYEPGESGVIPVSFNSSRFNGNITKTITVTSNDAENPKTVLHIKGVISSDVNVTPTFLNMVNVPRNNDVVKKEIHVETTKMDKLEISEVTSNQDFVKAEPIKVSDKKWVINVSTVGKQIPTGRNATQAQITFKTNSPKQPEIKARVQIRVAQPIQVTPRSVYFFSSKKGEARETTVNLRPNLVKDFKVLEMKSDLAFIQAEVEDAGGNKRLKVKLTDAAKEGKFNGVITLKTDLEDQPQIHIPVRGSVI
ncbi:DUF1573 domain-containing protein [Sulfidibacter corallicola]|uniref:DUF1573 domain-containing protein n=1 Tax=Sulfidibacter corallicola TaxID=2818388 RepID=A0A8A4TX35_SULCO|nr:DUF1573 domain-containing protein [Sulfidibacter corallicola]QTD51075.1 DUF1573 domain-containing protein [Sulfidibacter corallicola]